MVAAVCRDVGLAVVVRRLAAGRRRWPSGVSQARSGWPACRGAGLVEASARLSAESGRPQVGRVVRAAAELLLRSRARVLAGHARQLRSRAAQRRAAASRARRPVGGGRRRPGRGRGPARAPAARPPPAWAGRRSTSGATGGRPSALAQGRRCSWIGAGLAAAAGGRRRRAGQDQDRDDRLGRPGGLGRRWAGSGAAAGRTASTTRWASDRGRDRPGRPAAPRRRHRVLPVPASFAVRGRTARRFRG